MRLWMALAIGILSGLATSCRDPYEEATSPFLREHPPAGGPRAGWLERVLVCPGGYALVAKLDTGAKTSSIHAPEFTTTERDGRTWVRFTARDRHDDPYTFERELVRMVSIKERDGSLKERPVIKLGIVLADTYHETEVNLEDRSPLNYRLLLGRTYLQQAGVEVNPSATFRTKANPARVPAP